MADVDKALRDASPAGIAHFLDTAETVGPMRAGGKRFWTGREVKVLRDTYPAGGVHACLAALPGRSAPAIYRMAGALKLTAPEASHAHRPRYASSDHIDALIRRTYQNNPDKGAVKRLAQTINRPRSWIRDQALRLGIALPRFKTPPWTAAEDAIIAEHGHLSSSALQARLKRGGFARSETAIVVRRKRMGVSTEDPDNSTATGLAKAFGVDAGTVLNWIDKGWLLAVRRGTARGAAQGGDQWWVHRHNVRAFVIGNPQAVDFRKVDKFWLIELLADQAASWRPAGPLKSVMPVDPPAVTAARDTERDGHDTGFKMNPETREVSFGGRRIKATKKEYAILELLATRAGRVVTRSTLMDHMYAGKDDPEDLPDIKILDVLICKLRRKLASVGARGLIATAWGDGYTLRVVGCVAPPPGLEAA